MKKLVYTGFIAFWAAIVTLVVVDMLSPNRANEIVAPEPDAGHAARYSLSEVAQHDSLDDCWMVVNGGVYDISAYAPRHPAPAAVLEPWCGREATEGMRTRGQDSEHSARAWRMLERYRIGVVRE